MGEYGPENGGKGALFPDAHYGQLLGELWPSAGRRTRRWWLHLLHWMGCWPRIRGALLTVFLCACLRHVSDGGGACGSRRGDGARGDDRAGVAASRDYRWQRIAAREDRRHRGQGATRNVKCGIQANFPPFLSRYSPIFDTEYDTEPI